MLGYIKGIPHSAITQLHTREFIQVTFCLFLSSFFFFCPFFLFLSFCSPISLCFCLLFHFSLSVCLSISFCLSLCSPTRGSPSQGRPRMAAGVTAALFQTTLRGASAVAEVFLSSRSELRIFHLFSFHTYFIIYRN